MSDEDIHPEREQCSYSHDPEGEDPPIDLLDNIHILTKEDLDALCCE